MSAGAIRLPAETAVRPILPANMRPRVEPPRVAARAARRSSLFSRPSRSASYWATSFTSLSAPPPPKPNCAMPDDCRATAQATVARAVRSAGRDMIPSTLCLPRRRIVVGRNPAKRDALDPFGPVQRPDQRVGRGVVAQDHAVDGLDGEPLPRGAD